MKTTVVQKLENLLLVAVPRDLTDADVLDLRREVLCDVRRHRSHWVLLDFSRVDICDSFFGRFIQSTANMAQLMGAQVIVSGLQDAVIETMIGLGMTLPNLRAVLDLDDALELSRTAGRETSGQRPDLEGRPLADETDQISDDGGLESLPAQALPPEAR